MPFPSSDTSWELTSMESKGNVNKHHKNSEIGSFETLHIKNTTQIGLWSHCRCYVGQYIYAIAILTVFSAVFVLSHAISTQHPETFHPASPLFFLNFPPSIKPLLHALKTELFFPPMVCSSATHLFVHFQKYLHTPKRYSSIQQRILAWTNSSRRARRHVWCWVEFHPHHCLRGDAVMCLPRAPRSHKGSKLLNKNGGPMEAVKNKCSVWVEGDRISGPFWRGRGPDHSQK